MASQLRHNSTLDVYRECQKGVMFNKIVATIGPKSQDVETLKLMILSGMDVARLNLSHGDHAFHQKSFDNVREAAKQLNANVAIAVDTSGPEIRSGRFAGGKVCIKMNQEVVITTDPNDPAAANGTSARIFVDYPKLATILEAGRHVFFDDGLLDLLVVETSENTIKTVAQNDHKMTDRRGVNVPFCHTELPSITEKDYADLKWAVEAGVDFVFHSYVREKSHVEEVRRVLKEHGDTANMKIVAKIENHEGVNNLTEIIEVADGLMVARGDLGVELPPEKIFLAQKKIISHCNIAGFPVICATQMLESMTTNPRPTRAEISDVANAILDGADAVMLSGETAMGDFPVEAVQYMSKIVREAQAVNRPFIDFRHVRECQKLPMITEESICSAAVNTAFELDAAAIVVITNTGRGARMVAKYRPGCPILAVTEIQAVQRQMTLMRGVFPVYYDTPTLGKDLEREKRVVHAIQFGKESMNALKPGDKVVAVHADYKTKGFANQTRILSVE